MSLSSHHRGLNRNLETCSRRFIPSKATCSSHVSAPPPTFPERSGLAGECGHGAADAPRRLALILSGRLQPECAAHRLQHVGPGGGGRRPRRHRLSAPRVVPRWCRLALGGERATAPLGERLCDGGRLAQDQVVLRPRPRVGLHHEREHAPGRGAGGRGRAQPDPLRDDLHRRALRGRHGHARRAARAAPRVDVRRRPLALRFFVYRPPSVIMAPPQWAAGAKRYV